MSVIFGLFALHGAVAPVVLFMQQRVVQVVGLCGACHLHGEAFPSLGSGTVLSLGVSQHVSGDMFGEVLPGTLAVSRRGQVGFVVGRSGLRVASADQIEA